MRKINILELKVYPETIALKSKESSFKSKYDSYKETLVATPQSFCVLSKKEVKQRALGNSITNIDYMFYQLLLGDKAEFIAILKEVCNPAIFQQPISCKDCHELLNKAYEELYKAEYESNNSITTTSCSWLSYESASKKHSNFYEDDKAKIEVAIPPCSQCGASKRKFTWKIAERLAQFEQAEKQAFSETSMQGGYTNNKTIPDYRLISKKVEWLKTKREELKKQAEEQKRYYEEQQKIQEEAIAKTIEEFKRIKEKVIHREQTYKQLKKKEEEQQKQKDIETTKLLLKEQGS